MKIIICGDIHGEWRPLNKLINQKKPDIILQCGDFGWWPKFHNTPTINRYKNTSWDQYGIKNKDCKIYFCDGNHEDHWDLKQYKEPTELMPNVFYMPRMSTLTLEDGRIVLFVGGASSMDRDMRKLGYDWFIEETISYNDMLLLPDIKPDIVISHTCPFEFKIVKNLWEMDPSREALSQILELRKPDLWFFGHWHRYKKGKYKDCKWYCLNMAPYTMWWKELILKE